MLWHTAHYGLAVATAGGVYEGQRLLGRLPDPRQPPRPRQVCWLVCAYRSRKLSPRIPHQLDGARFLLVSWCATAPCPVAVDRWWCSSKISHYLHESTGRYFRDQTKGGWPFSTRDIGWVVADCTGAWIATSVRLVRLSPCAARWSCSPEAPSRNPSMSLLAVCPREGTMDSH